MKKSSNMQMVPAWLRFDAALRYASMTKHQLRPLLLSGEVYGKKIGRVWLVSRESLDNYLKQDGEGIRLAALQILR